MARNFTIVFKIGEVELRHQTVNDFKSIAKKSATTKVSMWPSTINQGHTSGKALNQWKAIVKTTQCFVPKALSHILVSILVSLVKTCLKINFLQRSKGHV